MPPEVACDLADARVLKRDGTEVRVERMQRMADLVDRLLFGPRELPVGIERVGLEEVADLVARIEEVSARLACHGATRRTRRRRAAVMSCPPSRTWSSRISDTSAAGHAVSAIRLQPDAPSDGHLATYPRATFSRDRADARSRLARGIRARRGSHRGRSARAALARAQPASSTRRGVGNRAQASADPRTALAAVRRRLWARHGAGGRCSERESRPSGPSRIRVLFRFRRCHETVRTWASPLAPRRTASLPRAPIARHFARS